MGVSSDCNRSSERRAGLFTSGSMPWPVQRTDPRHHTQRMETRLQETIDHLRAGIEKVDEPQLKAMFETSAEVLGRLKKAFSDYEMP